MLTVDPSNSFAEAATVMVPVVASACIRAILLCYKPTHGLRHRRLNRKVSSPLYPQARIAIR
jgi:hypothetical protein